MVTTVSLILSGGIALLAGGGSHAVTRSHYQKKIRELEAQLLETRRELAAREAELEEAHRELEALRTRLAQRERRLSEVTSNVDAVRDIAVDLDRRLAAHTLTRRRVAAALTFRTSQHRRALAELSARLANARDNLQEFGEEETALHGEITSLREAAQGQAQVVEVAARHVEDSRKAENECEGAFREAVGV